MKNELYYNDYCRYKICSQNNVIKIILDTLKSRTLQLIFVGRKVCGCKGKIQSQFWALLEKIISRKIACEIDFTNIGKGIVLGHGYGITVASGSVLGENVTLFKGSTIGAVRSGKKGDSNYRKQGNCML